MGSPENLLLLIRAVLWLKRRALGLAFLLAIPSWFVLVGIWIHSATGGITNRILGTLLTPESRVGHIVGQFIFPDYATRGSTGWYVVPLFGAMGQFVLLMALWYVGIRLVRRLHPYADEQEKTKAASHSE